MVKSWDFWDTLVTRCVVEPSDIFQIIEERSGIAGFSSERIRAEIKSRHGVAETSIERIYQHLPYDRDTCDQLKALEIEAEISLCSPITENIAMAEEKDLVVSDMYLGGDILHMMAAKCGLNIPFDNIYVSCEHNATKHDGGLFDLISNIHPVAWHCGDNVRSDVHVPLNKGLECRHYQDGALNKLEQAWKNQGVDGRYFSGLIRAARLACKKNNEAKWLVYSQIISPVLVQFVEWVLQEAVAKDMRKIFFLSRDGQILHKIAQMIIESRLLGIEVGYLFVSRQSLHLPGHISIEQSESWLLDNTSVLSIGIVAQRAGLPEQAVQSIVSRFFTAGIHDNLSNEQRLLLKKVIREDDFIRLLEISSAKALQLALGYFIQEGLISEDDAPVAIVDVGWNARMQRSIDGISKKSCRPFRHIHGYYLGVSRQCVYQDGSRVHGFIMDPFTIEKRNNTWLDSFRGMLEFFLRADHPSVSRYQKKSSGVIEPVFMGHENREVTNDVHYCQAAILAYAKRYCQICKILQRPLNDQAGMALNVMRNFLLNPTMAQAQAFVSSQISEQQVESHFLPLVKRMTLLEIFRKNTGYSHGVWPAGSHRISGSHLYYRFRLALGNIKRKIVMTRTNNG